MQCAFSKFWILVYCGVGQNCTELLSKNLYEIWAKILLNDVMIMCFYKNIFRKTKIAIHHYKKTF